MRNTTLILSILLLISITNADSSITLSQLKKCTNANDRLICSQNSSEENGFVYLLKKKKLHILSNETTSNLLGLPISETKLSVFKCDTLLSSEGYLQTPLSYTCTNPQEIRRYSCLPNSVTLYYEDKYGFPKQEEIQASSKTYCNEKFHELLP